MRKIFLTVLLFAGSVAHAQAGQGMAGAERARIEQQLRMRMGEIVQQRLGLSPEQMQLLNATNRKFDRDRVALLNEERSVRMQIRQQIEAGDKASQDVIAALLDSTLTLERRRLDLIEGEQTDLKKFLTARQRAQYFGLQTQMRNRMEMMRRNREMGEGRRPPQ